MKPHAEKYFFAAAGLCLWLVVDARAQSLPVNAVGAVTNFSAVIYFEPPHEKQVKARFSGAEALPLPGALFDLRKMKVENFDTAGKLFAVVQAPQCTYAIQDGMASSAGHLDMKTGDGKFHVEGDGFLWRGTDSSLVISNNVRTVIKMDISNLTKL